jgi:SAM-dependent methyltransferase
MRERPGTISPANSLKIENARHVPYDERTYFASHYRATAREGPLNDRHTIGHISEPEARFHYNAVENSIIRAVLRREPVPTGAMLHAWRLTQQRRRLRLLDVGAGTGHWVDFFRATFFVGDVVAVEIVGELAAWLREKYAGQPVQVVEADMAEPCDLGGTFDWISAIGVMFHIVDDERWRAALRHLGALLKPGGLLFVGGDFGPTTRDAQFHRVDQFTSWSEYNRAAAPEGELRVNKRLRSLAMWDAEARAAGLQIADLIRTDSDRDIMTPENDLLVLVRPQD